MPPTIRDVAKLAGTSVGSVSAALNGTGKHNIRVGLETRARIHDAARQLRYTPNPVARGLATRRSGVIGLAFPYAGAFIDRNPYTTQIMQGVFEEVVREKYNLMLHMAVGGNEEGIAENILLDPRMDGLILVLPAPGSHVLAKCRDRQYPCVAVTGGTDTPNISTINADDVAGGKLGTQHLIDLGHRRIAYLCGSSSVSTSVPRRIGYLSALREHGIEASSELILDSGFDWRDGYDSMAALLELPREKRPTAVFAANDLCADGVLRLLRERGLSVPDDISVVGYDDTWYAEMTGPKLTSVHMPIYEMGVLAAQVLIAIVRGEEAPPTQHLLPVHLTVRESTKQLQCN